VIVWQANGLAPQSFPEEAEGTATIPDRATKTNL
jgi:hypothetical protein